MKDAGFDDPHAALLGRATVRELAQEFEAIAATEISRPRLPADRKLPTTRSSLVGPSGVDVPVVDEDLEPRPAWKHHMVMSLIRRPPLRDRGRPWASGEECASAQERLYGTWLPEPDVDWGNVSGPEGLARFARQGLAAHRLEATPDGGFVLDLDALAPYAVRRGYASYGGVLQLDAAGGFLALQRHGRNINPDDDDFEHEALAFRSTAMVLVTLVDHLGLCHLGAGNGMLLSVRRTLAPDHPLRQFLRPFQFGTAAINGRAVAGLIPRRGLVHRMFGLEWDALQDVYRTMLLGARVEPLPDRLKRQGTHPDQLGSCTELFPWSYDGALWYKGLADFVDDAVKNSRALGSVLSPAYSSATEVFWDELGRHIRELPPLDLPGLATTLTWLLHAVTALHAHVGNVVAHGRNPTLGPGRVVQGALRADRQSTGHLSTLVAIAGDPSPTIAQPWHHLMPDDGARQAALRFNGWLADFQDEVDARNASRSQPFTSFSPRVMSCSVGR